jgi:glucose/arabinose dehydrogenase
MLGGTTSIRRALVALTACALVALASAVPAADASLRTVPVGDFDSPTYVENAPGYPGLLFVVERSGVVEVLDHGDPTGTPFLDADNIVRGPPDADGGDEEGLFSIAFAPDYRQSRLFYVAFVNRDGNVEVDEFKRSTSTSLLADASTRRPVIVITRQGSPVHAGGQLQFGPDDYLYLGTGDGGTGGAPAPDLENLLGKIIRIDPHQSGANPYTVPSTNPYVGAAGRDEIYSYGLREPWRFSFDGSRLLIGDVGQSSVEEVDFLPMARAAGANFGWPEYEGDVLTNPGLPGADPVTFPVKTYEHEGGACAIAGGYVVRDRDLPSLFGRYLYGDFCTGEIRSFVPKLGPPRAFADRRVRVTRPLLSSFGEGAAGSIYIAQLTGEVSELVERP